MSDFQQQRVEEFRRLSTNPAAAALRCGVHQPVLCLGAGSWPTGLVAAAATLVAAAFGAAWAFVPAWLQARRGSHVVITTIMFNFIASAVMTHLLVNVLIKPGQQ